MAYRVQSGDPAPDFALTSAGGEPVRLADFRGKSEVVLFFYPREISNGKRSSRKAERKSKSKTLTWTAT